MDLFKILGIVAVETDDAKKALDDVSGDAEDSGNRITSAFQKIGTAVAAYFAVDKIAQFGEKCLQAAADANAMSSQFEQVFSDDMGNYAEQAQGSLTAIAVSAGISENRMKGSFTQIAAFAKTTGMDTADALALSERAMVAVADSAAFYDRTLEETTASLQSFLKGNFENDAALGLSCTETTRNAAANELYGKSFIELSESQKQLTLLKMVEDANAASGALGQASRESDTWTNQLGNLKQAATDFSAMIGANFLPVAISVVTTLQEMVTWLTENERTVKTVAAVVGVLTVAIAAHVAMLKIQAIGIAAASTAAGAQAIMMGTSTTALGLHTIATNIATAATSAFGAVMAFVTSPITLVILAIGALIAIIVLCVKHWDEIKEKAVEVAKIIAEKISALKDKLATIWSNIMSKISSTWASIKSTVASKASEIFTAVSTKFNNIKNKISETIENARDKVKSAIDKIRSFFNFDWSLPKIKLPHFKINGSFSLNPPSVPSFGVDWYAKGGVLEEPTIFGVNGNRLMGGGEAGAEAVAPIDVLQGYVAEAVANQNAGMVAVLERILDAILSMDANMGGNLREALDGTSLSINHREFGRLVKAVN